MATQRRPATACRSNTVCLYVHFRLPSARQRTTAQRIREFVRSFVRSSSFKLKLKLKRCLNERRTNAEHRRTNAERRTSSTFAAVVGCWSFASSSSSSSSSCVGVGFVFVCRSVFWGCVLCLFSLDVLVVASCVLFGQRTRCMLYVGCVLSLVSFVSVWFGCVAFIVLKS